MNGELFVKATRHSFRYPSGKGLITTEDLWSLNMEQLDTVFQQLSAASRQSATAQGLIKKTDADNVILEKMEIVHFIFNSKVADMEAAANKRAAAQKKQNLLELIEKKQNAALEDLSIEELTKMVNSL